MAIPDIATFNTLGKLMVQKYERYLPTAFDESLTLLEKINKVIEYVNQTGRITNELIEFVEMFSDGVKTTVEDFIAQFGDNLEQQVIDTLEDWQTTGKLDVVISQALQTQIDDVNAQLIQKTNELEVNKLDRNENESISKAMLNQELKEELNNGVFEFSLNTSEIENKAIKQSKIGLETGYLPKTILYTRGYFESTQTDRATSELLSLPIGTIIKSNNDTSFSVKFSGDTSSYMGWIKEWIVAKNIPLQIVVKRDDDSVITEAEVDRFSDFIEVITPETALKRGECLEDFPLNPVFDYGTISPSDGEYNPDASRTIRVSTPEYIFVKKGSKLFLKDTSQTSYALYIEGSDNYVDGWSKNPYTFEEDTRIKIMQKFDDTSARVSGQTVFFTNNVEIVSNDTFIRGRDVKDFVLDNVNENIENKNYNTTEKWVWGYEYMFKWYDKLRQNQPVKMVWAGDSTTLNSGLDVGFTRSELGKKLLTLGGYDETLVTSINAGHGTQHTGNWLGGDKDEDKRTPNGFLDEDMLENPDLYIFGYGFNDGSNSHFPDLTWEERITRFEENLNEGLERIRGTQYNKSPDDMAIILCTPISAYDVGRGNIPEVWNDKIRPIIQKACIDYHCAFVDITARQYNHGFSDTWSTNGDLVHPNETANVDYMSMFDDIIMPRLLHK